MKALRGRPHNGASTLGLSVEIVQRNVVVPCDVSKDPNCVAAEVYHGCWYDWGGQMEYRAYCMCPISF
jgi:hypothetical protein